MSPEEMQIPRDVAGGVAEASGVDVVPDALEELLESGTLAGRDEGAAPSFSSPLKFAKKSYPDTREGFEPHEAIVFSVTLDRRVTVAALLEELLGDDAAPLIWDWRNCLDLSEDAPGANQVVFFRDSNT